MSYQTISSTQPDSVLVEPRPGGMASDVWLRRNIKQDTADRGEDSAAAVEYWVAEELHFVAAGKPTVDEVTADFDALWAAHEEDGMTASERMAKLAQAVEDNTAALIELGDLIGGE